VDIRASYSEGGVNEISKDNELQDELMKCLYIKAFQNLSYAIFKRINNLKLKQLKKIMKKCMQILEIIVKVETCSFFTNCIIMSFGILN